MTSFNSYLYSSEKHMRMRKIMYSTLTFLCISSMISAQVTERERPASWDQLVEGGRFADRFLPMPDGKLSSDTWGAQQVIPRFIDNGIEDLVRSYWGATY